MARHVVKIFGERNTGTRALGALLRQLPDVGHRVAAPAAAAADGALEAAIETQMRGAWKKLYLHALRDEAAAREAESDPWKHALPRLTPAMVAAGAGVVVMVRNPYSWLVGLARRPYHIKGPNAETLDAFAARPWMTERREGMAAVVASPVDLWAEKAAAALALPARAAAEGLACHRLRFEDFVADPAGTARACADALALPAGEIKPRERNTKAGEAGLATLQSYYSREHWRGWLTRSAVARVNARLDPDVVRALGYAFLAPDDFPDTLPEEVAAAMAEEMASLRAPAHRALPG
ncbi:hypothetical protein [Halovulum marinum]|uniref:hypothetical protein n=1 Tax=Halovulum marinum TaxID=2662447 RepID=UPI0012B3BB9E|nr:hypothetical protein [Halovulum marinum]